ncbi:MAG: hypothetical protein IIY55_07265, partial [Blautia sp.]|nr:hypothetical protein [Blautia sp.]
MESSIQVIKEAFATYSGMNPIWALYILSLVYILLLGKKEGRHFFLYPLLMLLCTVFNPFLVQTVLRLSGHQTRYHRVFWMIPFYMT